MVKYKLEGFDTVELVWPDGASPACPSCGNGNAMLDCRTVDIDDMIQLRDAGLCAYECRDCGHKVISKWS